MVFRCISCGWKSDVPSNKCLECGRKDPFQQKKMVPIFAVGFVIFIVIITYISWNA